MPHAPEPNAAPAGHRPLSLYEILAIVLLWNTCYKGARVANTLYALELGAGPLDTGLLLATYGFFPLLLAVFTGKIADRYGVRVPVVVGSLFGLAPVFWPSSAMLALGSYTGLARKPA